jgi:hypothetical protein
VNIVRALKAEASKLQKQLGSINSAIEVLNGSGRKHRLIRTEPKKRHRMSRAGRLAIARAQRERWAKVKKAAKA